LIKQSTARLPRTSGIAIELLASVIPSEEGIECTLALVATKTGPTLRSIDKQLNSIDYLTDDRFCRYLQTESSMVAPASKPSR
jgi:hypothetical protein